MTERPKAPPIVPPAEAPRRPGDLSWVNALDPDRPELRELLDRIPGPSPLDSYKLVVTPRLLGSITFAHRRAAAASALRFSHFSLKRMQQATEWARIESIVGHMGRTVWGGQVAHVLAGDSLPPIRRATEGLIRRAGVLMAAVDHYCRDGKPTTPAVFCAYLGIAGGGLAHRTPRWASVTGQRRDQLLDLHRDAVRVDPWVARLYSALERNDYLSAEPLMRTAVLFWMLADRHRHSVDRMALTALLGHELRAGGLDPLRLLQLSGNEHGREAQALWGAASPAPRARQDADMTPVLEHFAHHVGLALSGLCSRLGDKQEVEQSLPWLMHRPPDESDRLIFEAVERRGSTTSAAIRDDLPVPRLPLRTLQRRLKRLVHEGLLEKVGSRKDAFYRLSERASGPPISATPPL
jgi:hypothetical protein